MVNSLAEEGGLPICPMVCFGRTTALSSCSVFDQCAWLHGENKTGTTVRTAFLSSLPSSTCHVLDLLTDKLLNQPPPTPRSIWQMSTLVFNGFSIYQLTLIVHRVFDCTILHKNTQESHGSSTTASDVKPHGFHR